MSWVGELIDIFVDAGKELEEIVKEGTNDIVEAGINDVTNIINGTPDNRCKTSYDIRDEADKIIDESNQDYRETQNQFDTSWNEMHDNMMQVVDSRIQVYQLLDKVILCSTLAVLPDKSRILKAYPSSSSDARKAFNRGTTLGVLGISARKEAAEEYLEDAKDYRVKVGECISELNQTRRLIESMSYACTEELKMLNVIRELYCNQSEAVLVESAEILHKIAEFCVDEVSTYTNQKYLALVQRLKQLWR